MSSCPIIPDGRHEYRVADHCGCVSYFTFPLGCPAKSRKMGESDSFPLWPNLGRAMRNVAAARRAPAIGAPALRSAACFPRASGARALGPRPCARRTSLCSAHATASHCGVRGNSSSWRSPPSTMHWRLVRSLRSCRDRHHKNALSHDWNGPPYSTAGMPAE